MTSKTTKKAIILHTSRVQEVLNTHIGIPVRARRYMCSEVSCPRIQANTVPRCTAECRFPAREAVVPHTRARSSHLLTNYQCRICSCQKHGPPSPVCQLVGACSNETVTEPSVETPAVWQRMLCTSYWHLDLDCQLDGTWLQQQVAAEHRKLRELAKAEISGCSSHGVDKPPLQEIPKAPKLREHTNVPQ